MSWLILNLIFGVFATLLILGVLSTGMRLEYGSRSERGKVTAQVVEAKATENQPARAAA